jgi:F0F1-type ATP synthase assembly protein I
VSSNNRPPKKELQGGSYRELGHYLGLGLNLAVTMIVFVYLGSWADGHFKRGDSLFLIIGAFCGLGMGLYQFVKSALWMEKKQKE